MNTAPSVACEIESDWEIAYHFKQDGDIDNAFEQITSHYPLVEHSYQRCVVEAIFDINPIGRGGKDGDWTYNFKLCRKLLREFKDEFTPGDSNGLIRFQLAVEMFREAVFFLGFDQTDRANVDWKDSDAVWINFLSVWPKVNQPEGFDAFERAVQDAIAHPITISEHALDPNLSSAGLADTSQFVLCIAYHLQLFRGDDSILLPVKRIGKSCGKSEAFAKNFGSSILQLLAQSDLLVVTDSSYSFQRKEAKQFRFMIDRTDLYRVVN